jgi:hypothetical protein
MIFSFSAFAAFLLISYYATTTSTKEVATYRNSYSQFHQAREIGKVIDQKSANGKFSFSRCFINKSTKYFGLSRC